MEAAQKAKKKAKQKRPKTLLDHRTGKFPPRTYPFKHPIMHMAIRAESGVRRIKFMHQAEHLVLEFAQKYRDLNFKWFVPISSKREFRDTIKNWLLQTPAMLEWFLSPNAYIAPRTYPRFLKEAFGSVTPPTPYELACMNRGKIHGIIFGQKGIFYLRAYCFGMSIHQMARITGEPAALIEEEMFTDLKALCEVPQFQLWCANVSWAETHWPIHLDVGMLKKLKLQHTLVKGPHLLDKDMVKLLTDSPYFWQAIKTGALKRRNRLRHGLNKNWLGLHSQRRG